jgi:hypothetical protein
MFNALPDLRFGQSSANISPNGLSENSAHLPSSTHEGAYKQEFGPRETHA